MLSLQKNAIFIADSHYNSKRVDLFNLLIKIKNREVETTQLYLMGDMFDFLTYKFNYFVKQNQKVIDLINQLSNEIEIIYFEGNHDFKIYKLFPNIKIIAREQQPLKIVYKDKNISLSHGDIFTPKIYDIFTKLIRSDLFISIINFIDINFWFSKKLEYKLLNKKICHKQKGFDDFIKERVESYASDLIIEGHYHQGVIKDDYINVPSLACDNRYIQFSKDIFSYRILKE